MNNHCEIFNIVFNSRNAINYPAVLDQTINNLSYTVNWGSILPKKYTKFKCQFVFKSDTAANLTTVGSVNMNLGRMNVFNANSNIYNLGFINPQQSGTNVYSYSSTNNDNTEFWIDYPVNNIITISLARLDGTNLMQGTFINYVLVLNLMAVEDDDKIACSR